MSWKDTAWMIGPAIGPPPEQRTDSAYTDPRRPGCRCEDAESGYVTLCVCGAAARTPGGRADAEHQDSAPRLSPLERAWQRRADALGQRRTTDQHQDGGRRLSPLERARRGR